MKASQKAVTSWIALGLSFLISFGAVQGMVTAFGLTLEPRWLPAAACLLGSVLAIFLCRYRSGGWLLMALWAAAALHLWRRSDLPYQFWQLIYRITHYYDAVNGWGVIKLVDTAWDAGTAQLPMALLGGLLAAVTASAVLAEQGVALPLLLSLAPLLSCLVVTDTVPAPGALFLLMLGQILLLLGSHVRRRDPYQADRLLLLALVPTVLFLGGIFLLLPKDQHVNHSDAIQARILQWLETLPRREVSETPVITIAAPQKEPAVVELASLGPRQAARTAVMEVLSHADGTLYLRGQDHDQYDGHRWTASPYRVEALGCDGPDLGILSIQTKQPMEQMYLPYYPQGGMSLIGGQVENTRLASSYTFRRQGLPEAWQSPSAAQADYAGMEESYLSLPESSRRGAEPILAKVLENQKTPAQQAGAIAGYLRGHSTYDLQAPTMPEGEEDFALWFLREAPPGYCVHYATAAVVLLRAAGIPARYVSGYLTSVEAGIPKTVTELQAHAWAEYYEPGLGAWLVVEATPAAGPPTEEPPAAVPSSAPTAAVLPEEPTVPSEAIPQEVPPVPTAEAWEPETPSAPGLTLPPQLFYAAAGLLLFLLQPGLRITLRRRQLRRAAPNRRCLLLWQAAEQRGRLLKSQPPQELRDLALKAKFSQHTITAQELTLLHGWLRQADTQLRKKRWYCQLLYRYIFALY